MPFFATIFGKITKSRTVWVGIGTVVFGAAELLPQALPYIQPYVPEHSKAGALITIILGIATVVGRIRAKQPLGPVIDTTIAQTVEAVHVLGISKTPPVTATGKVAEVSEVKAIVQAIAATKPD